MKRALFLPLVLVWAGMACAAPTRSSISEPSAAGASAQTARTLVAAVQSEPKSLAARPIAQAGTALSLSKRIFNADLTLLDDQLNPYPYLVEALPQLNTESWKVFPNGTMETTYRLRPNLVWHDGRPLTADDFVFSWEVYAKPEVSQSGSLPLKLIARVEARDVQTVLIRWAQPFAGAGALQSLGGGATGLPPLPRSILEPALESGAQGLINAPFWTVGYLGLGPYKLDRWEPGAFVEASAFDRHVLGVARIQHIQMRFLPDANTALAGMLAGELQLAGDNALRLPQINNLFRQWPSGRGAMVPQFSSWQALHLQNRPDFVSPPPLQDVRVRQALAHAVDRIGINESLFEGQLPIADSPFPPSSDLGQAANSMVTKYPFDLGRSEQLMAEAGFAKRPGDFYVGRGGAAFSAEVRTDFGDYIETLSVVASGWRKAGFDFKEMVVPPAQAQDLQVKSTYPGVLLSSTSAGEASLNSMGTDNIPRPENQWRGSAWDGYSNPELDRLITSVGAALDPAVRNQAAADLVKLYSSEVPAISLFFNINPWVFTSDLKGPMLRPAVSNVAWNLHEWELTTS